MEVHYITFLKSPYSNNTVPHSAVHAHIRTLMAAAATRGADLLIRKDTVLLTQTPHCISIVKHSHIHSHSDGAAIWSHLGISILPKDLTCSQGSSH